MEQTIRKKHEHEYINTPECGFTMIGNIIKILQTNRLQKIHSKKY